MAGYAIVAAVFLALWAVSQPLAGAVTVGTLVGLAIVARRALRLLRCFRECGGFALDLGRTVRIRVTRPEVRR